MYLCAQDERNQFLQINAWFQFVSNLVLNSRVSDLSWNINKAIVDSRLRPQTCCNLANCIAMQEIVDCKLDANNE